MLVLLDPDTGTASLPGGAPGPGDREDPLLALRRKAREEAAAEFGEPLLLGHFSGPGEPGVRLRHAAALTRLGPPPVDPVTGRARIRILAAPEQALELFDRGPQTTDPLAAVHRARARLGIPRAVRRPVTEPADDTDLTT
ncbi:hypothetical protein [Streptomyces sp. NPDC001744]|uniref:hypothetical protein n=1 Tax=Streptomyces sp. NPDC001744 TaxID=3364606 RepID=UPI0036B06565